MKLAIATILMSLSFSSFATTGNKNVCLGYKATKAGNMVEYCRTNGGVVGTAGWNYSRCKSYSNPKCGNACVSDMDTYNKWAFVKITGAWCLNVDMM